MLICLLLLRDDSLTHPDCFSFGVTPGPTLICITECARYTRYIAFGLWLCVIWTVNTNQKKERLKTCDDSFDLHVAHTSRKQVPLNLGASSPAPPAPVLLRRPSKEATAPAWKDCWCEGVGCIMLLSDLVIVDVGVWRYCWWWRWGIFSLKAERLANWIWNEVSLDVL